MRRCIVILLAMLLCGSAFARGGVPGLRTEWGIVAGVNHPMARFAMEGSSASLKAKTGLTAGIHTGLRIVGVFGVQPEILYSYNTIALEDVSQKFSANIKCHTLQVPLLLTLKFGAFKIVAGPQFTVVDNPAYADRKGERVLFGQLYPTVSYTAGVGLSLFNRLLIDARVSSGFKAMENCLSYDIASQSHYIKTTMFNAQLMVGVLF